MRHIQGRRRRANVPCYSTHRAQWSVRVIVAARGAAVYPYSAIQYPVRGRVGSDKRYLYIIRIVASPELSAENPRTPLCWRASTVIVIELRGTRASAIATCQGRQAASDSESSHLNLNYRAHGLAPTCRAGSRSRRDLVNRRWRGQRGRSTASTCTCMTGSRAPPPWPRRLRSGRPRRCTRRGGRARAPAIAAES